jgi:hypothetical protein
MEQEMNIFDVDCEIESMEHVIRKEMELFNINVFFDFLVIDGLSGKLKWDNGVLGYDNKFEILLYHLIQYKSNVLSEENSWTSIPNVFFIDKYTFRKQSKVSIKGFLKFVVCNKLNPLKSKIMHLIDYLYAVYIFPKPLSNIGLGYYKNKLGESFVQIKKDKNGKNTLFYFNFLNSKSTVVQSKFNKDIFFIKGIPNEKFKKIESIDYKTTNIYKTYLDGSFTNFEILKEFTN